MVVKTGILGVLIYLAIGACVAAWVARLLRARRLGEGLFALGAMLIAGLFGVHCVQSGRVPVRNLFDVFLGLALLAWPLSLFCRRLLGASSGADPLLTALVLVLPGFVFDPAPRHLPPALQHWLFIPHVTAYILADIILIKATIQAAPLILRPRGKNRGKWVGLACAQTVPQDRRFPAELAAHHMVLLGVPLLTAGLLLGATWGKIAWGSYWNWDPKELWSLATWLVYVAYFHYRALHGTKHIRWNAVLVTLGGLAVVATLLWVNLAARLFRGLHSYGQ